LAPTTPVEDAYSDLQAWLSAPQDQWLRGLGMRPREWGQAVDDLEALALDERQRAELLRQQLQRHNATDPDPDHPPDWCQLQRGTGVLPPGPCTPAWSSWGSRGRSWPATTTCTPSCTAEGRPWC
ncbi:MAG: exonuclease V subunit gamma, partial [Synechococcaceae bacterium WB8_1B_136]|nr:exonuclease V subunit gamma [Synechococcaceae bacterium WB8_1B_136]